MRLGWRGWSLLPSLTGSHYRGSAGREPSGPTLKHYGPGTRSTLASLGLWLSPGGQPRASQHRCPCQLWVKLVGPWGLWLTCWGRLLCTHLPFPCSHSLGQSEPFTARPPVAPMHTRPGAACPVWPVLGLSHGLSEKWGCPAVGPGSSARTQLCSQGLLLFSPTQQAFRFRSLPAPSGLSLQPCSPAWRPPRSQASSGASALGWEGLASRHGPQAQDWGADAGHRSSTELPRSSRTAHSLLRLCPGMIAGRGAAGWTGPGGRSLRRFQTQAPTQLMPTVFPESWRSSGVALLSMGAACTPPQT